MRSVLEQNCSDFEYIVIDGGSTDGSREYIEASAERLAFCVSEKDSGIYEAMNKGLAKAEGTFVAFLNSGDYYVSNNLLQYAAKRLDAKKADVFFCRFIWDNPLGKVITISDNAGSKYDWHLQNSNFPHPATFYKRSIFDELGIFDESYKILGDFDWNCRALVTHRVRFQYVDIITAFFRAEGVSNSSATKSKFDEEMEKIIQQYFRPGWLFKYMSKQKKNHVLQRVMASVFNKKMNRIW